MSAQSLIELRNCILLEDAGRLGAYKLDAPSVWRRIPAALRAFWRVLTGRGVVANVQITGLASYRFDEIDGAPVEPTADPTTVAAVAAESVPGSSSGGGGGGGAAPPPPPPPPHRPNPEGRGVLTVGSLFSGIGGLELGLERAAATVIWQSEIDPYACRLLAKHWPAVPNLGDITQIDWSSVERPDVICGGYPCPAFSQAARGRNVAPNLWPWMRDAIDAVRPDWVLLENVAAHLDRGFDRVLSDLAALGFDAEWSVVTACAVGAPHTRRRLFAVAYPHGQCEPVFPVDGEAPRLQPTSADRRAWLPTADDVRADDGLPRRVDRLRALGNAVVPQVAEFIGRRIVGAAAEGRVAA